MADRVDGTSEFHIEIEEAGPYVVHGAPPPHIETITTDADGGSRALSRVRHSPIRDRARLCRCGQSQGQALLRRLPQDR